MTLKKPTEDDILNIIPTDHPVTRKAIIQELRFDKTLDYITDGMIDKHIRSLENQRKIYRPRYGEYQKVHQL